jgi:hypothetical protein
MGTEKVWIIAITDGAGHCLVNADPTMRTQGDAVSVGLAMMADPLKPPVVEEAYIYHTLVPEDGRWEKWQMRDHEDDLVLVVDLPQPRGSVVASQMN